MLSFSIIKPGDISDIVDESTRYSIVLLLMELFQSIVEMSLEVS